MGPTLPTAGFGSLCVGLAESRAWVKKSQGIAYLYTLVALFWAESGEKTGLVSLSLSEPNPIDMPQKIELFVPG